SSRRRHTRWPRDWSSDVCSSDLGARELRREAGQEVEHRLIAREAGDRRQDAECVRGQENDRARMAGTLARQRICDLLELVGGARSEERRVGKGWGVVGWVGAWQD